MKNLLLVLVLHASAFTASAQAFPALALHRGEGVDNITFTIKEETNICYYLLEGSHDSLAFEIIARTKAAGNTRLPRSYTITSYDTAFGFYRVRQVDMTAGSLYSASVTTDDRKSRTMWLGALKEPAIVKRQD